MADLGRAEAFYRDALGFHAVSRGQADRMTLTALGGRNRSRLFICASHTLFAIYTNQRGAQRP